jgi:hypothetical protein
MEFASTLGQAAIPQRHGQPSDLGVTQDIAACGSTCAVPALREPRRAIGFAQEQSRRPEPSTWSLMTRGADLIKPPVGRVPRVPVDAWALLLFFGPDCADLLSRSREGGSGDRRPREARRSPKGGLPSIHAELEDVEHERDRLRVGPEGPQQRRSKQILGRADLEVQGVVDQPGRDDGGEGVGAEMEGLIVLSLHPQVHEPGLSSSHVFGPTSLDRLEPGVDVQPGP